MSHSAEDRGTSEAEAARAAWGEFFVRHNEFLYHCCRGWGNDAADIVAETFRRVRLRAETFKFDQLAAAIDSEGRVNIVRGWLGQIAWRVGIDLYRERLRAGELLDPVALCDLVESSAPEHDSGHSAQVEAERLLAVVQEALEPCELEVLDATLRYYDADRRRSNMPSEVLNELAQRLGRSPEAIRQIRRRAFIKIRERLNIDETQTSN